MPLAAIGLPVLILTVFAAAAVLLGVFPRRVPRAGFSGQVLVAVPLGVAVGLLIQAAFGRGGPAVEASLPWIGIVGGMYVRALQMVVMPLVFVSVSTAVARLDDARALGWISAGVLGVLLATTAVAASIGIGVARVFGLRADGLVRGARELERGVYIEGRAREIASLDVPSLIQSFVPTNVFADLAGSRPTATIGVVVFGALIGLAALALRREQPAVGERVRQAFETMQALVLRLVKLVIRLTPYGVLALMTHMAATSDLADVYGLGRFVVASYVGLALILFVHAALLAGAGLSPVRVFRKVMPTLAFAFTSRSSVATIPLNVETQVTQMGVPPAVANVAATFGTTIGQNGCAGLYPAMLAVMIAPSVGVDAGAPAFMASVVGVATLGSFGIAGVGGGATFAAIVVLSTLNLPIALAGLLIAIEPLIDMGRTAVNVNGSIVAGVITSRLLGQHDARVFEADRQAAAADQRIAPRTSVSTE